ncbi:hypothetical protein, partial [Paraburkholderia humisilvae]|uniref:hypothetical protein n=1 Tax=Paraburkholderia humisilvae TaxID=627669 RepID=UPI001C2E6097
TLGNGTVAPAMNLEASRIALRPMPRAWILSRSPCALKHDYSVPFRIRARILRIRISELARKKWIPC